MDERDLVLDGNAVAGALQEVFAVEITTTVGTCAGCGAAEPVGALVAYVRGPGIVVRCRDCDGVMIRLVRGRGRYWLDVRGVKSLELGER